MPSPTDVPCPRCRASIGQPCVYLVLGSKSTIHAERKEKNNKKQKPKPKPVYSKKLTADEKRAVDKLMRQRQRERERVDRTKPIELACGHRVFYPEPLPRRGDWVWCGSCADYAISMYRLPDS